jgi:hypothetical protein
MFSTDIQHPSDTHGRLLRLEEDVTDARIAAAEHSAHLERIEASVEQISVCLKTLTESVNNLSNSTKEGFLQSHLRTKTVEDALLAKQDRNKKILSAAKTIGFLLLGAASGDMYHFLLKLFGIG